MILFEQNRKNFICRSIKMSSQRTEGSDVTDQIFLPPLYHVMVGTD
jgi:hypothetical protein